MKDIAIKQTRGPAIYAKGTLVCSTDFDTRDGFMELEVWETQGGAYIAVSRMEYDDSGDRDVRATVVEPIVTGGEMNLGESLADALTEGKSSRDLLKMRFAVMDFFGWADRARTMVREAKWDLRWRVA